MKTTALMMTLLLFAFGLGACGKKGELESPDNNKDTAMVQTRPAGN